MKRGTQITQMRTDPSIGSVNYCLTGVLANIRIPKPNPPDVYELIGRDGNVPIFRVPPSRGFNEF